jgi:hypothetical protein
MDDELQQLEAELKQFEPSRPSRELFSRIEHELTTNAAPRPRARLHWQWVAWPAAAAIAFMLVQFSEWQNSATSVLVGNTSRTIPPTRVTPPLDDTPLKPVAAENLLISATDEGVVTLADGTEARRERLRYVDTITWKNARTNASLTWRVPREEVRVMPIVFQ